MDKLPISARILITLCFFIACLTGTVSLLAVVLTAANLSGGLPLRYFEQLNFPALTVIFPVIGMVVVGAIALVLWIKDAKSAAPAVINNVVPAEIAEQPKQTGIYPKAA